MNWKEQLREDLANTFSVEGISTPAAADILFIVEETIKVDVIQKLIDDIPDDLDEHVIEGTKIISRQFHNPLKQQLRAKWLGNKN